MTILADAKQLAKEYRALTGRPLGVTAEVAEYEAVQLLGLELAPVRQAGYDAVRRAYGREWRLQIKGRCLLDDAKPGQRLERIRLDHEWDGVLVLILNGDFEVVEITKPVVPPSKPRSLLLDRKRETSEVRWPSRSSRLSGYASDRRERRVRAANRSTSNRDSSAV